jgi:hypothetical protein
MRMNQAGSTTSYTTMEMTDSIVQRRRNVVPRRIIKTRTRIDFVRGSQNCLQQQISNLLLNVTLLAFILHHESLPRQRLSLLLLLLCSPISSATYCIQYAASLFLEQSFKRTSRTSSHKDQACGVQVQVSSHTDRPGGMASQIPSERALLQVWTVRNHLCFRGQRCVCLFGIGHEQDR